RLRSLACSVEPTHAPRLATSPAGLHHPHSYNGRRAHDGRAARGVPRVLRGEWAPEAAVRLTDPARRRPLDPLHERRHAAADALLPRPRAPAGTVDDDVPEVLPDARHRRGRPRHLAPDVPRDARQLLVRPVLQPDP